MKNILIIGCGLLGSSLLRRIQKKKIANKIYIYEKSKSCIAKIKRLKTKGIIVRSTEDGYHIKNKLRLTIGSKNENLAFMSAAKKILN